MVTRRRIRANRENAKKSTGPRTEEGKRRSSQNAMTHGILTQEVLIAGEDAAVLAELRDELNGDLAPEGAMEALLVDQMVACMWRYRRLLRVESGLFEYRFFQAEMRRHRSEAERHVSVRKIFGDFGSYEERTIDDSEAYEAAQSRGDAALAKQAGPIPQLARSFVEDERSFSALARYKTAILRDFHKAYHELERLQRARGGEVVEAPVSVDVNVTAGE